MANRYWVGGTGTWDGANTTHWSATSGGTGGASAPTSSDNVFFNASSGGGTVTISSTGVPSCKDLSFVGFTGTYVGTAYRATVTGNYSAGSTATMTSPRFTFTASNSITATLNFGTYDYNQIFLNPGSSSTLDCASNLIATVGTISVSLNGGVVNTNNYIIECAAFRLPASTTGTFNSGTSAFYVGDSFTLDATSTVASNFISNTMYLTKLGATDIYLGGKTFAGGVLSNATGSWLRFRDNGTIGSLTYTTSSVLWDIITFYANVTISGLLSITGNSGLTASVESDVVGTQRTVSAGSVSLTGVTFKDIYASGAAIPWTGVRLVDNGNNTNIKFSSGNGLFFGSNF